MIRVFHNSRSPDYYATNAYPRIVDGKPSKNPRYLQVRPDLRDQRSVYLANISSRLYRHQDAHSKVLQPVTAILPGRRNNPEDLAAGVKPLCVNNPIHYMELPELFMEFIASITGKSPSTTGAGSEGALTKKPFNALLPIYDLNNALVAYLITEQPAFVTAAGYVGPNYRVDHDISLLIPEIWCRMRPHETDPQFLIEHGYLEKVSDFEHEGELIQASRTGHRITSKFVRIFFGRVFSHPETILNEEMLKPELQDREIFVTGMKTIIAAHKEAALNYFEDGSVEQACPPLKALLHIMAYGEYESKSLDSEDVRKLFTRDYLLNSEWYQKRLKSQQAQDIQSWKACDLSCRTPQGTPGQDIQSWKAHVNYLENFLAKASHARVAERLDVKSRLSRAKEQLAHYSSKEHLSNLVGTIGKQPL